jgi:hypothetical protein
MVAILVVACGWRPADVAAAEPPPEACATIPPPSPPSPPAALFDPVRPPLERNALVRIDPADERHADAAQRHFAAARRAVGGDIQANLATAERYARFAEARLTTIGEVGMPVFRPWMSKAGRPMHGQYDVPEEFYPVFERELAKAGAGSWDTEGTIDLAIVAPGGATLVRGGLATPLPAGKTMRLRRLDLIAPGDAPLVMRHTTLGEIVVPPKSVLASWHLPAHLGAEAKRTIAALIAKAGACDPAAQRELEHLLPAAHEALAAAIASPVPEGAADPLPGRGALRLLLALYDE